jgi:hypothetical protein
MDAPDDFIEGPTEVDVFAGLPMRSLTTDSQDLTTPGQPSEGLTTRVHRVAFLALARLAAVGLMLLR